MQRPCGRCRAGGTRRSARAGPGVAPPVQPRVGQQVAPLGYAVLRMLRPQLAEHMLHPGETGPRRLPSRSRRCAWRENPARVYVSPCRRVPAAHAGLRKGMHDEQQQGRPLAEQPTQPLVEQRAVGLPPERGGFEQDVRAAEVVPVFIFAQPVEVQGAPVQTWCRKRRRSNSSRGSNKARAVGFEVAALRGAWRERVVLESVLAAQWHQSPAPEIVGDVPRARAALLCRSRAPRRIGGEHLQVTVHRESVEMRLPYSMATGDRPAPARLARDPPPAPTRSSSGSGQVHGAFEVKDGLSFHEHALVVQLFAYEMASAPAQLPGVQLSLVEPPAPERDEL